MPRARLNLAALRTPASSTSPRSSPTLSQLVASEGALTISRRELLGLAGVAALALPPATRGLSPALLGAVELVSRPGRVALKLAGRERWVVETRRFAGSPRLQVEQDEKSARIVLSGARYPGTRLSADFECELRRGLTGWRMRLRLQLIGTATDLPLESWLVGAEPARFHGRLSAVALAPASTAELRFDGLVDLEFSPDWTLRLHGRDLATFRHDRDTLVGSTVALCLTPSDAGSLFEQPPADRTSVFVSREGHAWKIGKLVADNGHGRLVNHENAFDTLEIEAGENSGGRVTCAFVARDVRGAAGMAYRPAGGPRDAQGQAFALPLRNPRYAVAVDSAGDERALLADFAPQPRSLSCVNCTLTFSGGAVEAPLEVVAEGNQLAYVRCEPTLLSFTAPLAGTVVGTAYLDPGTRVALLTEAELPAQSVSAAPPTLAQAPTRPPVQAPVARPPAGQVILQPQTPAVLLPLAGLVVPVLRPEDMLALTFRFVNLTFRAGAGNQPARLERTKAGEPTYIVVEFPPQHIGEEALFETAAGFPVPARPPGAPAGAPPDADAGASAPAAPKQPPLGSRLSGPSRLAFRVPDSVQSIKYTLPFLLDWSQFELSVVPVALPPPVPPTLKVLQRPGGPVLAPQVQPRVSPGAQPSAQAQPVQPAAAGAAAASLQEPGISVRPQLVNPNLVASMAALLKIQPPGRDQTAIEAPYRLILSPSELAAFVHAAFPVIREGRVELWHTRLGVKGAPGRLYDTRYEYGWDGDSYKVLRILAEDSYAHLRTLRAIWSPDYSETPPLHSNTPFRMSLDGRDRSELVTLTSDFKIQKAQSRTVAANRLMLSALGVWMDTRYAAMLPKMGLTVEEWVHQATMARDQYVKVVYKGYMYPFGHAAALVKVTERKFLQVGTQNIAYLMQRMFIVIREPEKTYPAFGQPFEGRYMPFRKVQITSLVTPNLNPPEQSALLGAAYSAQSAFWPMVQQGNAAVDFQWHMVGEDWDGQRSEFTVPLAFVGVDNVPQNPDIGMAYHRPTVTQVGNAYMTAPNLQRRTAQLMGQNIAFADSDKPGDTTLQTDALVFSADLDELNLNLQPQDFFTNNQARFYPRIFQARVRIPAAATVADAGGSVVITIHDRYGQHGWEKNQNPMAVFAKLDPANLLPLSFSGDKSGGVATPNLDISGLSRTFGPVSDVDNLAGGNFDPSKFFKLDAKVLGTVQLSDIIQAMGLGDLDKMISQIPGLITERELDPTTNLPRSITTTLAWRPKLQSWPKANPIFYVKGDSSLEIKAVMKADLTGQPQVTATVDGAIKNVALNLIPVPGTWPYFVQVNFKEIGFHSQTDRKLDFSCELGDINFGGPLSFINPLAKIIPLDGLIDPPVLDVDTSGIKLGYTLGLPTIGVGVFSIQNISFGALLTLPWLGDMTLRFAFCERESPFLLTVSIFGGGGFFAIELALDGIRSVEASFEFGGNFSMDIGVASGGAYIMAGIYFKMAGEEVTLEGYLRCGGHLNVLGIINISIEFYMGLKYQSNGTVTGRCSLDIEISILFFSVSVTLTVERQFAGGGSAMYDGVRLAAAETGAPGAALPSGIAMPRLWSTPVPAPPSFTDLMTPEDWAAYAAAFA